MTHLQYYAQFAHVHSTLYTCTCTCTCMHPCTYIHVALLITNNNIHVHVYTWLLHTCTNTILINLSRRCHPPAVDYIIMTKCDYTVHVN